MGLKFLYEDKGVKDCCVRDCNALTWKNLRMLDLPEPNRCIQAKYNGDAHGITRMTREVVEEKIDCFLFTFLRVCWTMIAVVVQRERGVMYSKFCHSRT